MSKIKQWFANINESVNKNFEGCNIIEETNKDQNTRKHTIEEHKCVSEYFLLAKPSKNRTQQINKSHAR